MLGRDSYLVPTLSKIPILRSMGSGGPWDGCEKGFSHQPDVRTPARNVEDGCEKGFSHQPDFVIRDLQEGRPGPIAVMLSDRADRYL